MSTTRWTLHRARIVNVYRYGDEVLHFGDGRLLLRGVNSATPGSATGSMSISPAHLHGALAHLSDAAPPLGTPVRTGTIDGLSRATIGLEKNFFDAALHEVFTRHILGHATVVSATPVLSPLRMLEDDVEVELLREAARVADVGMAAAASAMRAGTVETMVAGEAEYAMRNTSGRTVSFAQAWRRSLSLAPK